MTPERILELAGVRVGDESGDLSCDLDLDGIHVPEEWDGKVSQVIGPLDWADGEPGYYLPVTLSLLTAWAEEHDLDPATVRVEWVPRSHEYEQVLKGTERNSDVK